MQNSYCIIQTTFFRAIVSLLKISQNAVKGVYESVTVQDFNKPWLDTELYSKYNLSEEEIAFI